MIARIKRWIARFRMRPRLTIDVVGARSLSPAISVYVIDVDGRRTVLAAGSHIVCVLSSYPTPCGTPEGPQTASV
jgi:flagellar biogenesis protein FliO